MIYYARMFFILFKNYIFECYEIKYVLLLPNLVLSYYNLIVINDVKFNKRVTIYSSYCKFQLPTVTVLLANEPKFKNMTNFICVLLFAHTLMLVADALTKTNVITRKYREICIRQNFHWVDI